MLCRRASSEVRTGRRARRGIVLALASLAAYSTLRADEIAWDNTSGDFLWGTPVNWANDALPSAADGVIFGDAGVGMIDLGGQMRAIDSLLISNTDGAYSYSNGTLQFNTLTKTGGGTASLGNAAIALDGAANINAGWLVATAANTFNGGTVNLAGGALELQSAGITFAGSYNVSADSALIASRASGTGGTTTIPALTLGDSTLSLSTLNGQTLKATAFTVGGSGAATINNEGTAQLLKATLNNDLTLTGAGGGEVLLLAGDGHLTLAGSGNYMTGRDIGSTFAGSISVDGGTLTVSSSRPLSSTRIEVNAGGSLVCPASGLDNTVIDLKGGSFSGPTTSLNTTTINYHAGTIGPLGNATLVMQPGVSLTVKNRLHGQVIAADGAIRYELDNPAVPSRQQLYSLITATTDLSLHLSRTAAGACGYELQSVNLAGNSMNLTGDGDVTLRIPQLSVGGAASISTDIPLDLAFWNQNSSDSLNISGAGPVTYWNFLGSLIVDGPGKVSTTNAARVTVNGGMLEAQSIVQGIVNGGTLQAGAVYQSLIVHSGGTARLFGTGTAASAVTTLAGGSLVLTVTGTGSGPGVARVEMTSDSTIEAAGTPGGTSVAWLNSLTLSGQTATLANSSDTRMHISSLTVSAPSVVHNTANISEIGGAPAVKIEQANLANSLTITGGGTLSLTKLSGPGDVIVNGTGTVAFLGTATNDSRNWTGRFVANSGTVALAGAVLSESFATASQPLVVNSGATLALDGMSTDHTRFFTRPLDLSGLGSEGAGALSYTNNAKDATIAAPITLNGLTAIYVNRTNPTAMSVYGRLHIGYLHSPTLGGAALTGTGPLVKTGGHDDIGVIWLNVPATYTGGTIINGGGILVNSSGSLANTGPIAVNPTGVLGVGRPAGSDPALNSVSPNSVSLRGGSLLLSADMDVRQFLAPDSTGGGIWIGADRLAQAFVYTQDLNFSQLIPGVAGSAWRLGAGEFGAGYTGTIGFDAPETLRLEGTGLLSISTDLRAANNIASLVVAGSGTARPSGQNDYAGDTTVLSGTLSIYGDHSIGVSTAPVILGDTQPNASPAVLYLNEGRTLSRDITIPAGPNAVRIRGSNALYSGSISLGRDTVVSGSAVTVAGVVSGSGGLTATDYSTIFLTNQNTYSGPTYVTYALLDAATTANRTLGNSTDITIARSGILRLRSQETYDPAATFTVLEGGAIGIAANLVPPLAPSSRGSFCIDTEGFDALSDLVSLGGGSMSLSSTTSGSFTGTILSPGSGNVYRFGGGGGRLVVTNPVLASPMATLLVGGDVSTSHDAGAVVLHGDNAYSGTTQITRGMLEAGDTGRILGNSTSITIASEGRLRLAAASNYVPSAKFTVYGILGVAGKFIPPIVASSSGAFGIDTDDFDLITNLASLGNGSMFFGSTKSGTLSSPLLLPGSGNAYRFGGGGGTLTVLADLTEVSSNTHSITVGGALGGTVIFAGSAAVRGLLSIQNKNRLVLQEDSTVGSLSISSGSTLELAGGDLAITGGALSAINTLAKNRTIVGSSMLDETDPLSSLRTIAVLRRAGGGVVVGQTWAGDLNGDRMVDAADYFALDRVYLSGVSSSLYADGDINYSGKIDGDDYFTIDRSFLGQTQLMPIASGAAAVPEPAALTVLMAGLLLVRRRR